MREKGTEKSSFPRITVREGLIPRVEASFFWLAKFCLSIMTRKSSAERGQPFTQVSQGQVGLEVNIDNNKISVTRL